MQSLERRIAVAVLLAALASAAVAAGAMTLFLRGRAQPGSATADAITAAIARGSAPVPLLDTFTAAGTIRSAMLYDASGTVIARTGASSPSAELVCRSLPKGSLCIEPATSQNGPLPLILSGVAALLIGLLMAFAATAVIRGRLRATRTDIEDAMRDPTYATRIAAGAGEFGPLTATINQLLQQVQTRDVDLRRRTMDIELANRDLESFASAVSHDLRAPLGSISAFAQVLDDENHDSLDENARECVFWIRESARQMSELIDGLLQMSRLARAEMTRGEVDLSAIARSIATTLQRSDPARDTTFAIPDGVTTNGDERLLRAVLENLIGNAWKFTSKRPNARIELGVRDEGGTPAFYVRDNGAGFDPAHAAKMFRPFQRLHSEKEFSGTGIGLATVQKIVQRHGGRAWAEGEPDRGATVYFTTGAPHETYA